MNVKHILVCADFYIDMFYSILVIPLAAEHDFLEWLDKRFSEIGNGESWSAWLQLLRLVYNPCAQDAEQQNADPSNAPKNLIDVDIFDDTEPNIFEETNYTAHNCLNYMIKNLNSCTSLDVDSKDKIISEYSALRNL